nr:LuxR family transcriptional regulator [Geodermatophilaceae bacterium]
MSTGRQRILDLCRRERDGRRLRAAVLAEIKPLVPYDFYAWLLTDPETRVGSAPLAEVPDLGELPRLVRLKYATSVNRWTALTPNTCATLVHSTAGELSRSWLWRDLMRAHGVTDVASMVFVDQFGCWGFLDLWRCGGPSPQFVAHERTFLASLCAELTTALRGCQAATFRAPPSSSDTVEGPTVLLLSAGLSPMQQTAQTDSHLRLLMPTATTAAPVPAAAYNVAAQLLAVESGVDTGPAQARAHLAGIRWLTLRAARLGGDDPRGESMIAVTMEPVPARDRIELYARTAGLTQRETELLHRLARGL